MSDIKLAFNHLLLTGTSLWSLYNINPSCKFVICSYGCITLYSLAGFWQFGIDSDTGETIYCPSHKVLQAFALPCIITELYVSYGYELQYAALHLILPLVPIITDLLNMDSNEDILDVVNLISIISGSVLSGLRNNYWGIAANATYLLTHFLFKNKPFSNVPERVFYNFGLNVFIFCAHEAILNTSPIPQLVLFRKN